MILLLYEPTPFFLCAHTTVQFSSYMRFKAPAYSELHSDGLCLDS